MFKNQCTDEGSSPWKMVNIRSFQRTSLYDEKIFSPFASKSEAVSKDLPSSIKKLMNKFIGKIIMIRRIIYNYTGISIARGRRLVIIAENRS